MQVLATMPALLSSTLMADVVIACMFKRLLCTTKLHVLSHSCAVTEHKLSVTPVVARIPPGVEYVPNEEEVAEVFFMPLESFLEDHERHSHRYNVLWRVWQADMVLRVDSRAVV